MRTTFGRLGFASRPARTTEIGRTALIPSAVQVTIANAGNNKAPSTGLGRSDVLTENFENTRDNRGRSNVMAISTGRYKPATISRTVRESCPGRYFTSHSTPTSVMPTVHGLANAAAQGRRVAAMA